MRQLVNEDAAGVTFRAWLCRDENDYGVVLLSFERPSMDLSGNWKVRSSERLLEMCVSEVRRLLSVPDPGEGVEVEITVVPVLGTVRGGDA